MGWVRYDLRTDKRAWVRCVTIYVSISATWGSCVTTYVLLSKRGFDASRHTRPLEVGGIICCVHTLLAIAARPHPSARHEHVHVPETHHYAAVSADRYTPCNRPGLTRPLEAMLEARLSRRCPIFTITEGAHRWGDQARFFESVNNVNSMSM